MLQLAKGEVVALALVLDPSHVLPSPLSPSYCLHFIRHYVTTHGLLDITDKGDQVMFGGGGLLEAPVSLPKQQRTNFLMWGSQYSLGLEDYYTVEAIVYLLHQVRLHV